MTLFDQFERTERDRPRRNAEPIFAYMNNSERPAIALARSFLNCWFSRFPDSGKTDLRARFQSSNETQHRGAFFELYCHELVTRLGYAAQVHPNVVGQSTHPDFLILRDETPAFYLECTVTGQNPKVGGQEARANAVYDALQNAQSPNFWLLLQVWGAPATPPRAAKLRKEVETWVATLNPDAVAAKSIKPTLEWEHDDWRITFEAWPKSPENRGAPGLRPIGGVMPEACLLATDMDIRSAIESKAKKYGQLDLPLIIAVNADALHCDRTDIMNALFGQETVVFGGAGVPPRPGERRRNGAWIGQGGPRNSAVSAALITSNLDVWHLASKTPVLYHHPWGQRAFDADWPLPQMRSDAAKQHMKEVGGQVAARFLGLPSPWPPEE